MSTFLTNYYRSLNIFIWKFLQFSLFWNTVSPDIFSRATVKGPHFGPRSCPLFSFFERLLNPVVKVPKVSRGAYFLTRKFWRAYFRGRAYFRELLTIIFFFMIFVQRWQLTCSRNSVFCRKLQYLHFKPSGVPFPRFCHCLKLFSRRIFW